jgi:hypothetical protein
MPPESHPFQGKTLFYARLAADAGVLVTAPLSTYGCTLAAHLVTEGQMCVLLHLHLQEQLEDMGVSPMLVSSS